ncbi:quinon protein alcohol dehydrogenase-like superfamily [Chytridium lagenaria]|nr:quinon protein alcohol dehydrogenase-like superfamily [Chytridium lagenaria]
MTASHLYVAIPGTVVAIDKANGSLIWKTEFNRVFSNGQPSLLPVPSKSIVLTVFGLNMSCIAINALNGSILWENTCKGMGMGFGSIIAPPDTTVAGLQALAPLKHPSSPKSVTDPNNMVIVGVGSHVRAIQASTGDLMWEHRPPESTTKGGHGALIVDDGMVFVGQSGQITAINICTGKEIWSVGLGLWENCVFATMTAGSGEVNRTSPSNTILRHIRDNC